MSRLHKGIAAFFFLWLIGSLALRFPTTHSPAPIIPLLGLLGITLFRTALLGALSTLSLCIFAIFFVSMLAQYNSNNTFMQPIYGLGMMLSGDRHFDFFSLFRFWFAITLVALLLARDKTLEQQEDIEKEQKQYLAAIQAAISFYKSHNLFVLPFSRSHTADFQIQGSQKTFHVIIKLPTHVHVGKLLNPAQYSAIQRSPQDFIICAMTPSIQGYQIEEFLWKDEPKQWLSTQGNTLTFQDLVVADFRIEKNALP